MLTNDDALPIGRYIFFVNTIKKPKLEQGNLPEAEERRGMGGHCECIQVRGH